MSKNWVVGLLLILVFALVLIGSAKAQQPKKIPLIGFLSPFSAFDTPHNAFREGLRDLGWIEGKNIRIEQRYANGNENRLNDLIADLIGHGVDIIVTSVTTDTLAAKKATHNIPIVMAAGDPLPSGLIENLARPGGNVTGLSQMAPELSAKRLEVLKEIVPKLSRVAGLWNPDIRVSTFSWQELQAPAREMKLEIHSLEIHAGKDLTRAFDEATRERVDALLIMPDPITRTNLREIANLAIMHRLPSVFHIREFADFGGLIAYGPDRADMFRRAAAYVDKILKGANPAELPIEQPRKFNLVLNLRTANQIGVAIPPTLLYRADKVIR